MTVDDVVVDRAVVFRLQGWLGVKPSRWIDATTAWHLTVDHGWGVGVS
jgi:hypothetical protein